ncbi:hypothetical protein Ae201684_009592 [Aphanomyces euteiches]|uniref:Uncharacterized protein n=1 Tax=Aphanomyces euteiches TaxID=100861 RepID=A0A6G0X0E6_9STRA|nr:hypothetical protein Ae201684_009592 [Aphanomyces euteiches]
MKLPWPCVAHASLWLRSARDWMDVKFTSMSYLGHSLCFLAAWRLYSRTTELTVCWMKWTRFLDACVHSTCIGRYLFYQLPARSHSSCIWHCCAVESGSVGALLGTLVWTSYVPSASPVAVLPKWSAKLAQDIRARLGHATSFRLTSSPRLTKTFLPMNRRGKARMAPWMIAKRVFVQNSHLIG